MYLIISNGRPYVGVAIDPQRRLRDHRGADTYLGRSLRKHGLDSFELLAEGLSWEEALARDIEEIAARNTRMPHGFNMTAGGEGCLGLAPSEKAVEKARARMIERNERRSPEERASLARKGGEASRAVTTTPEWGAARSTDLKKHYEATTPEQRRSKMVAAVEAAREWSEERKQGHSVAMRTALAGGRGWSEERRKKQAERMRQLNLLRSVGLENQVSDV